MADRWHRLGRRLRQNAALKLAALAAATATIYAVRGATSFEVPHNVPVEVRVEKGMALVDLAPRTVEAVFRGAQGDLARLRQEDLRAVITAHTEGRIGEINLPVRPEDIRGGHGVRVVDVRPPVVKITVDREEEKTVPIQTPRLLGRPRLGEAAVDYEPRTATLRGPAQRLHRIHQLAAEPVDVEGRAESFTCEARLLLPGDAWPIEIIPPFVTVRVHLSTQMAVREVGPCPVLAVVRAGAGVAVETVPSTVRVIVEGTAQELRALKEEEIRVGVDCSDLDPSLTYDLPVQWFRPGGSSIRLVTDPPAVKVTLRKR